MAAPRPAARAPQPACRRVLLPGCSSAPLCAPVCPALACRYTFTAWGMNTVVASPPSAPFVFVSVGPPTITSATMANNVLSVLLTPPANTGGQGAAVAGAAALPCLPGTRHAGRPAGTRHCSSRADQTCPPARLPPLCCSGCLPCGGGASWRRSVHHHVRVGHHRRQPGGAGGGQQHVCMWMTDAREADWSLIVN